MQGDTLVMLGSPGHRGKLDTQRVLVLDAFSQL